MTTLRTGLRVLLAALLALALVAPAALAAVPQIRDQVTDETGVLAGGEDEIRDALDRLQREHNVQLWVVFVETTGGLSAEEFAFATAEQNSLGANDALLVVAIDDRTDQIWLPDGREEITDAELDAIIGTELEPRLAAGDFVGAVVATADALGEAAASPPATAPPAPPPGGGGGVIDGPGGQTDGGGLDLLPILLLLGGGGLLVWWFLSRRRQQQAAEERDRRTGRLAREANSLLIATDERVRDATMEIGFVEAEYGEPEVAPLRDAIATAREELQAAFAVRQRLDDSEPETPEQREQMLNEIIERSKKAQAALDREQERIQALRDLERDAPVILERLPERIAAVEGRLPATRAAFDSLGAFGPATRAPVVGHLEEARKGLQGAAAATERGRAALASDRKLAAREARTAEQGLTGAAALLDAVDQLVASAREAQSRLPAELRDAERDLADARRAARETPGSHDEEPMLAAAATALREGQAAAARIPLEPLAALRAATEAHRLADEALAAVRQDAEQHARLLATVDTVLATARAEIDVASNFIATRRGSVGRTARTRLAEADRLLRTAAALRDRDPQQALDLARRAERLAEEALDLADDDVDRFGGGGMVVRGGGSDLAGAILGGILGGILSGGGRGGGWGGSPWGSSGPFGGGGGGWGGPFGGGGGGGWGGGGFGGGGGGGGGGRSRGGRW